MGEALIRHCCAAIRAISKFVVGEARGAAVKRQTGKVFTARKLGNRNSSTRWPGRDASPLRRDGELSREGNRLRAAVWHRHVRVRCTPSITYPFHAHFHLRLLHLSDMSGKGPTAAPAAATRRWRWQRIAERGESRRRGSSKLRRRRRGGDDDDDDDAARARAATDAILVGGAGGRQQCGGSVEAGHRSAAEQAGTPQEAADRPVGPHARGAPRGYF